MDVLEKEDFFILSSVSIEELEDIKTNRSKDDDVKYRARKAVRFLSEHPEKYEVIVYRDYWSEVPINNITADQRIIICALYAQKDEQKDIIFCSDDILARLIAKDDFGLAVTGFNNQEEEIYKGYQVISLSDTEMAHLYEHLDNNLFNLNINEYLIVKDSTGHVVDTLKWTENGFEAIRTKTIKSSVLGSIKPLDEIQRCAVDSIVNNDITVLYGRAGSGKTTLPLYYIMQGLEKGTFKKCYIIYSYEPLKGARTLGYEKGNHTTKLLYSASLGNILSSKFGDIFQVERMMDLGQIEIIPTANIRGIECGSDSVLLVTESQNLDVYTLKTIIQRCKEGCKQIYEGDIIEQKDTNIQALGMNRLIEVFKGHPKFGCVKLKNNYRGELTELADKM